MKLTKEMLTEMVKEVMKEYEGDGYVDKYGDNRPVEEKIAELRDRVEDLEAAIRHLEEKL